MQVEFNRQAKRLKIPVEIYTRLIRKMYFYPANSKNRRIIKNFTGDFNTKNTLQMSPDE
jgi:hypothetical protein